MMKPIIQKLGLLVAMLLAILPMSAYDFEADGFYYNITNQSENEVEVTYKDTSYNSYSGVANIPATVSHDGVSYTVTSIGRSAFEGCKGLLAVTIPNSVTIISYRSFWECRGLRTVTIGAGVKSIGNYAFSYSGFDRYVIEKVIWLGNTPPDGIGGVIGHINYVSNEEFSLSNNQKVYPFLSSRFEVDNVVYVPVSPSDRTCDVIDCNYAPSSTEIVIDSIVSNRNVKMKVLNVNNHSFYANPQITSITISNSGNIGNFAFCDCDALTTVVANNNGNIGERCFSNCRKLSSVKLGSGVTEIGDNAFEWNKSLQEIIIPDNVTKLGREVFLGSSSLSNVVIGRGITSLPESIFNGCSKLPSIVIPANILSIGDGAFNGCSSLGDVVFEELELDGEYKTFPEWTSTNHGHNTFSVKEYSIAVKAGDVLYFEIWSDCESFDILSVYIGDSLIKQIGGRSQVSHVVRAFPASETINLKVVYKKDGSGNKGSDEAGIRNVALNYFPLELGSNYNSPLFSHCKLDEVFIGRKLWYDTSSECGYSPFYRNTSLRSVKITDAETQIYENEFYGCSNLQEFSCGDGVTSIGNRAFSGCSSMTSYVSGTNVQTIGDEAFSDCTGLTSFTSNAAVPPTCGTQALDDINKWECSLYVPSESVDDYQAADQWKEFFFIEELGVEDVSVDIDYNAPVEIYNLSGAKVESTKDSLAPGIYIFRQGKKVEKAVIR